MKTLFKMFIYIILGLILAYSTIIILLYAFQEKLIFLPQKLSKNQVFEFDNPFEEKYVITHDSILLHGILFKSENRKGIILYFHGNMGSLLNWGLVSNIYTEKNYDLFMVDYRGYGKSMGRIENEKQLYEDAQTFYSVLRQDYAENEIILIGHSLGSAIATKLAADHNPRMLILLSPYYSMKDLISKKYPIIPSRILKYMLRTDDFIKNVKCPVYLIHGKADDFVPPDNSERLKLLAKPTDELFFIDKLGHNGINQNYTYQQKLDEILNR